MRFGNDLALLLSASQTPLMSTTNNAGANAGSPLDFEFKTGADVFSPVDLVTLPRPGAGLVSPDGQLVVVPVSTYNLQDAKNNKTFYITSVSSTVSPFEVPLARGGEAFWLDAHTIGHVVRPEDDAAPQLLARDVEYSTELRAGEPYVVGTFPDVDVGNFKKSPDGSWLVFSADVYPDRDLNTVKQQDKEWKDRGSSALVYEETFVRHWDTFRTPKSPSLFSVRVTKSDDGKFVLGDKFNSVLKDTNHHSPVEPFGGTDNFDVSLTSVIYTAKDADVQPAWHTRQNIYVVPIEGGPPVHLTSGKQGATTAPVFSASGSKVAWLELAKDGAEADKAQLIVHDFAEDVQFQLLEDWTLSPSEILFSHDDSHLILTVGEAARARILSLPLPSTPKADKFSATRKRHSINKDTKPSPITTEHHASGVQRAGTDGSLVFSQSSLRGPNNVFVLSPASSTRPSAARNLHSAAIAYDTTAVAAGWKLEQLTDFGLEQLGSKKLDAGEEFFFTGAKDVKVQGWVIRPPGYSKDDKKKWPVVLFIHGGPQGVWDDNWSTRWNPNVWAQQGYVVVAINPTGSTTFGQDFTDAISGDWGGRPFEDLRKGWAYVKEHYPQIDFDRAVGAGASWGGYAVNWIAGHPEWDFGFKALFCHDGVFDTTYNGLVTDELYFFEQEFGAPAWTKEGYELSEKFNPARLVGKWTTPMLIVHGSKDFRLPDTEGISAFQALQRRKIKSRLVIFPDENHWVLNHKNSLKWHWEVFRWFHLFVGAGAQQ
ncbi:alpha/beta-hydrolase [Exidia glandulosa HHB12029]|uniref:Dipeptidyl-peptidase V n=1 Tax=Exidia glandulosa HHB12029 TaxID=1314781 RepID=A0A165JXD3_EXIGL|nr:alpha/beta-hydrolase [Exidia glandulosa HHB12029]